LVGRSGGAWIGIVGWTGDGSGGAKAGRPGAWRGAGGNHRAEHARGLKIEENWYKGNDPVGGDTYRHPRPLPVNEVIEVSLKTPRALIIGARNQYQFSHANGTIKATTVKTLDLPKPVK
jgi:hypothetical protein